MWIQRVRQNKTILDSLRSDLKLRDGNCGLSVTIKAQCAQEMRLGCWPKAVLPRDATEPEAFGDFLSADKTLYVSKYSFLTISRS